MVVAVAGVVVVVVVVVAVVVAVVAVVGPHRVGPTGKKCERILHEYF